MNLTDELRGWVLERTPGEDGVWCLGDGAIEELLGIADRIEHEAERSLLPAPADRNGKPVLMDDTVSYRGKLWHVVAMSHTGKLNLRTPGRETTWAPSEHVLWHPEMTWDDIYAAAGKIASDFCADAGWVAEIIDRCRFLADAERR